MQAYILIQTQVGRAAEVADRIAALEGVTLAEDVTGPYDVIVRAEAEDIDQLASLVVARIQRLEGIERTLTCPIVRLDGEREASAYSSPSASASSSSPASSSSVSSVSSSSASSASPASSSGA